MDADREQPPPAAPGAGAALAGLALLLLPIAVVAAVLVPRTSDPTQVPSGPVTIRVQDVGGYRGWDAWIGLPRLLLSGGRLSGTDVRTSGYPVLPAARVADVDPATAASWAGALRAAGVGTRTEWGISGGDVGTTQVEVADATGRTVASVGVLDGFAAGLAPDRASALAAVRRVVDGMDAWLRQRGTPLTPTEVLLLSGDAEALHRAKAVLPAPPADWTGPALDGGTRITNRIGVVWRCRRLTAGETSVVVPLLTAGSAATTPHEWRSGSGTWVVRLLPVLPGQTGCADLPSPELYWGA